MIRTTPRHLLAACTVLAALCVTGSMPAAAQSYFTPSGLGISEVEVGEGAEAKPGQTAVVHYKGWLYLRNTKGRQFDSSEDRGKPFEFVIGKGRVIPAWDEGVANMRVGGRRTLLVPPELGYGAQGAGDDIPPNSTLIFDIELLDLKD